MKAGTLKIGTRGSALALAQANWVAARLRAEYPACRVELVVIKTSGDIMADVALAKIGGKGLFVKEIEDALLARRIDLAVHSMKDMPSSLPTGLIIAAIPQREDPRDVLISRGNLVLEELPAGARIGTGSLRRSVQLREMRPDLEIMPLRGNLDTRLRKIESQGLDGIVLAAAGMRRLGWEGRITAFFATDKMLPAVGQGAIGIEVREGEGWDERLSPLQDVRTSLEVTAERSFLLALGGGCQLPIAGLAEHAAGRLRLRAMVASPVGGEILRDEETGLPTEAFEIGRKLGERILSRGGMALLAEAVR